MHFKKNIFFRYTKLMKTGIPDLEMIGAVLLFVLLPV